MYTTRRTGPPFPQRFTMGAMIRSLPLALLPPLLLSLAACATSTPSTSAPRGAEAPRVRCLSDPNEQGTRPLFFLFCVQSP